MARNTTIRLCITLLLFCSAALGALYFFHSHEAFGTQIKADVVVDDFGRFICDDSYSVEMAAQPDGRTCINILKSDTAGFFTSPDQYAVFMTGARADEERFVAIDRYKRIWIYVGASSAGRPKPSVYMHSFDSDAPGNTWTEEVSVSGNWTGVPQEFLARVRTSAAGQIDRVPITSPPVSDDRMTKPARIEKGFHVGRSF